MSPVPRRRLSNGGASVTEGGGHPQHLSRGLAPEALAAATAVPQPLVDAALREEVGLQLLDGRAEVLRFRPALTAAEIAPTPVPGPW